MRELKFRAWEAKSSTMMDWITICQTAFNLVYKGNVDQFMGSRVLPLMYYAFTHPDMILLQYIGINDESGVEIYKGDVVEIHFHDNAISAGQIVYTDDKARFSWKEIDTGYGENLYGIDSTSTYKIIGNIYQNPELLEVKA